jgi:hypothetical protein
VRIGCWTVTIGSTCLGRVSIMRRLALVAIRYSQERSELRPSNRARPLQAGAETRSSRAARTAGRTVGLAQCRLEAAGGRDRALGAEAMTDESQLLKPARAGDQNAFALLIGPGA